MPVVRGTRYELFAWKFISRNFNLWMVFALKEMRREATSSVQLKIDIACCINSQQCQMRETERKKTPRD